MKCEHEFIKAKDGKGKTRTLCYKCFIDKQAIEYFKVFDKEQEV